MKVHCTACSRVLPAVERSDVALTYDAVLANASELAEADSFSNMNVGSLESSCFEGAAIPLRAVAACRLAAPALN